ncbi:PrsW family intramembrane metalloprotease [Halobacteriales archaeon Cl-PHB]
MSDAEEPERPEDPVKTGLGDSEDLYDVATWDPRSLLDRASVRVYRSLVTARSVVLVTLAAVLFVAQLGVGAVILSDEPLLGVLAGASVAPALVLVGYIWWDDPTRREPFSLLAVTFLLAILFATFAAIVNSLLSGPFALFGTYGLVAYFFLVVGPIEEFVKWLAIRVQAYNDPRFDAVINGAIYGAVAGLGFATVENFVYIANTYVTASGAGTGAQLEGATLTAAGRAFVGPGHVIFSAFAGYYLGLAKFNPENRGPIVVKGLLIAAFIHGLYNTLVSVVPVTGVSVLLVALVYDGFWLAVLLRKLSRYSSYYDRAVEAGEVEPTHDDG